MPRDARLAFSNFHATFVIYVRSGGCTAVTRSPLFPVRRRGPNTQIKPIRRGEEPLRREEPEHPIPCEIRTAFACPACNPTMQQAFHSATQVNSVYMPHVARQV